MTSILSLASIVISVAASVIGVINHKRIRSSCCGRKTEVSLDIENTTPPTAHDSRPGFPAASEGSTAPTVTERPPIGT